MLESKFQQSIKIDGYEQFLYLSGDWESFVTQDYTLPSNTVKHNIEHVKLIELHYAWMWSVMLKSRQSDGKPQTADYTKSWETTWSHFTDIRKWVADNWCEGFDSKVVGKLRVGGYGDIAKYKPPVSRDKETK